jgi:hypothetical protein
MAPLFAKRETKARKQSSISPRKDLIVEIEACYKYFQLCEIIRENSGIFYSNDAIRALVQKLIDLKPKMTNHDLSGLLNTLSKARIPPTSQHIHRKMMATHADLAIGILDTFDSRDIAMTLNGLARRNVRNERLFEQAVHTIIPIIGTFNAQSLANTVNAYAKLGQSNPQLFDAVATAAIPIIGTFNAQELANTVNAFAKLDHRNPQLFNKVAKSSIPIIGTFNAQSLANIANAYAKLGQSNPQLFDAVATAAIPIIGTFNAQELANTVNAFAKLDHSNHQRIDNVTTGEIPISDTLNAQNKTNYVKMGHTYSLLFDAVATTAIPIIDTFSAQGLANMISAFARLRVDSKGLFLAVEKLIVNNETNMSSWCPIELVATAYAFMKARENFNGRAMDVIGREILSRDEVLLDARELGNLAAAFSHKKSETSAKVIEIAFLRFQKIQKSDYGLEPVEDIISALEIGQRLQVVPPGFLEYVVELSIEKSADARPSDVRGIILNLSRVDIDDNLYQKVLISYKPIFQKHLDKISATNQSNIAAIYDKFRI